MPEYLHPGVYVQEGTSGGQSIAGVDTTTACFLGQTDSGDVHTPVLITSVAEFRSEFGGGPLASSVDLFFANGGQRVWIVRTDDQPDTLARAMASVADQDDMLTVAVPGVCDNRLGPVLYAAETQGNRFVVVDGPGPTDARSVQEMRALLLRPRCAALYWPWIEVAGAFHPPSAAVCGLFTRTDTLRGVWKAPAGTEASLVGATGVSTSVTREEQRLLNRAGINVIRDLEGTGVVVWGSHTLGSVPGSDPTYVAVERTLMFLYQSIVEATAWAVFEPNTEALCSALRAQVESFLHDLWRQGAIQGPTPREAYLVTCDPSTTTDEDVAYGVVNLVLRVALLRPAEFRILTVQQKTA